MARHRTDILQGTLALLVLRTLDVHGRLHGYAITSHIHVSRITRPGRGTAEPRLVRP